MLLSWSTLASAPSMTAPATVPTIEPAPRLEVERRWSSAEVGTHFPVVRVVAQRDGDVTTPYARLQNLARVRVVVS